MKIKGFREHGMKDFVKKYHENGVLRSQGYMTAFYGTPIGIWNYYSNTQRVYTWTWDGTWRRT